MLVSCTHIRIKNILGFLRFLFYNFHSFQQLKKSSGLIQKSFHSTSLFDLWTLSAWENEKSLLAYINNGAHLDAMKNFRGIADTFKTKVVRWETEVFPTWDEAIRRNNESDYEYEKSAYAKLSKE